MPDELKGWRKLFQISSGQQSENFEFIANAPTDIAFLLSQAEKLAEVEWCLEEMRQQSIAHADDSLSSKWLNQMCGDALKKIRENE